MSVTQFTRPTRTDREPTFHCVSCFDEPTAWRLFWCPGAGALRVAEFVSSARFEGMSRQLCGRHIEHAPHAFSERCGCSETNPVIHQHRLRAIESARKRGARDKAERT